MEEEEKYHSYLNRENEGDDLEKEVLDFLSKAEDISIPKSKKTKEEIWAAIDDKTATSKSISLKKFIWPIIAIAASILIAIFIRPLFFQSDPMMIEVTAEAGSFKEVTLPDGSSVTLNALSSIAYAEDWDRNITMTGEAFFEVTKGEKFKVKTDLGSIEVLGTSFNVFSREGTFSVACKTGKVKVQSADDKVNRVLEKGDGVVQEKDTVRYTLFEPAIVGKWKTGEFYFEKRPLSEVLEEVKRQYNVSIVVDSLEDKEFTGYFINSNLELALTMVCEPLDLNYNIVNDRNIVIKSN